MRRWHITDMLIAVSVIILLLTLSVMPFVFTVDVSADMFANYGEIRVQSLRKLGKRKPLGKKYSHRFGKKA